MDNYDLKDEPKPPRSQLNIWDMLSILVLVITLCIGAYFALIFANPLTPLNPLPPIIIPTSTATQLQLPPTWTPTVTVQPTETATLAPLITVPPTFTPVLLVPPTKTPVPTTTPKPTSTPKAAFSASVNYISSTIFHPEAACNWVGVGGTIVDTNNAPLPAMVIRLVGTFNNKPINLLTVSNASRQIYGDSGFEFVLGTVPMDSKGELYLQALDQAGLPLSDNVYINTYADCNKNLVQVRFKKNR
jgi:hypothetical protein